MNVDDVAMRTPQRQVPSVSYANAPPSAEESPTTELFYIMELGRLFLPQASECDVPALIRLLRRSWLGAWAPELPFEAVQAFAAADPARTHAETMWPHFHVAAVDDELVGVIHVAEDRIIDPQVWREGVGSKLMDFVE